MTPVLSSTLLLDYPPYWIWGLFGIQSYSFLVRLETWRWRLIWCCLALSRARYSVLSHDYDVNISVCFAEPSRALFFGERKKNIVTMKRIMKLLIASALLLSLTKAAQSVKQDGKIHSFLKRISRVSTFPAPKFFRRVLMKQF